MVCFLLPGVLPPLFLSDKLKMETQSARILRACFEEYSGGRVQALFKVTSKKDFQAKNGLKRFFLFFSCKYNPGRRRRRKMLKTYWNVLEEQKLLRRGYPPKSKA